MRLLTLTRALAAAMAGALIAGMAAVTAVPPPAAAQPAAFSDAQRQEIGTILRDYLLANPEVLRDALMELERRESEAEAEAQSRSVADNAQALHEAPEGFVIGNPQGDVTLVEFFDYNCTYCRRALVDLNQLIDNDPNLRVVLKEFPLLSEESLEAARVSIAAGLQDRYFDVHRALLETPGQVDGARALTVAEGLGLDVERLRADAGSDAVTATLSDSIQLAQTLGLNGTPSYVVGGEVVVGAVGYNELRRRIAETRAAGKDGAEGGDAEGGGAEGGDAD